MRKNVYPAGNCRFLMIFPLILPRLPGGNRQKNVNIDPQNPYFPSIGVGKKQDLLVGGSWKV